jgi:Uma2 family endonuclease
MEAIRYIPHYTIEDYLQWKGDWELWAGVPVSMSPSPSRRHQRIARRLVTQFQEQLEAEQACHCEALYEVDWHVADDTVVCPDIVIECEPNDEPFVVKPPALIVEVLSPTTTRRDHEEKFRLYQAQGVKHYLMVDTDLNTISPHTLRDNRYERVEIEDGFELHGGCSIGINTDDLWKR